MEFNVNSFMGKAKDTLGVVANATQKAVSVQKKKFDVATVKNNLNKAYTELGKAYFEFMKNSETVPEELSIAFKDVEEKLADLENAKEELEKERQD